MSGLTFFTRKRRVRLNPDELIKFRKEQEEKMAKETLKHLAPDDIKYVAIKAEPIFNIGNKK